jgi:hypothetical protein
MAIVLLLRTDEVLPVKTSIVPIDVRMPVSLPPPPVATRAMGGGGAGGVGGGGGGRRHAAGLEGAVAAGGGVGIYSADYAHGGD